MIRCGRICLSRGAGAGTGFSVSVQVGVCVFLFGRMFQFAVEIWMPCWLFPDAERKKEKLVKISRLLRLLQNL